jgi:hypothetical protein
MSLGNTKVHKCLIQDKNTANAEKHILATTSGKNLLHLLSFNYTSNYRHQQNLVLQN